MSSSRAANLEIALVLAGLGVPVFPATVALEPDGSCFKRPSIRGWRDSASTDPKQIAAWWQQFPAAVPGIELGRADLVVIDADRHGGPDGVQAFDLLVAQHAPLPPHPVTSTPGDGMHHIFRQPAVGKLGNRRGRLPNGFDVRGAGGWIVAPGSVRPDGATWKVSPESMALVDMLITGTVPVLPVWLTTEITDKTMIVAANPTPTVVRPQTRSERQAHCAEQALRSAAAEVAAAPVGTRNSTLNSVTFRMAGLAARNWIPPETVRRTLSDSAKAAGLSDVEIASTVASAWKAGVARPADGLLERQTGQRQNVAVIPAINIAQEDEPRYRVRDGGIEARIERRGELIWLPLSNFEARIVAEVDLDDGIDMTRQFELQAILGGRQVSFRLSSSDFAAMGWPIAHIGAQAIVEPAHGARDRLRAAVQWLSNTVERKLALGHTGWREIDGKTVFLHAGGALGALGPVDVAVSLPENLALFSLPAECCDPKGAIAASLSVRRVAPDRITVPLLGAVFRAPIGGADFSLHLAGETGSQKSELAALAQQHFGAGMNARHLPESWSSTANALEAIASAAKDVVLTVDDFVPQGTAVDRARLNAMADRVLRAQGNRSGRARMRANGTIIRPRPPRGLVLSTGEEVPAGASLRARMLILELAPGQVDLERLTISQHDASDGRLAEAMSLYIRWLAPRLTEVRASMNQIIDERRAIFSGHARTVTVLAQVYAAWTIWLRFAGEAGAVQESEAMAVAGEVWETLLCLAAEQHGNQQQSDPVLRFVELLASAISSGRAHVATVHAAGEPKNPEAWGWRKLSSGPVAQGTCVGWLDDNGLYLDPDASYAAAAMVAAASGGGVGVAPSTLHRRLLDRRLLLSTDSESGVNRCMARRTIGGRRRRVLHVAVDFLGEVAEKRGPPGPYGPAGE